MSVYVVDASVAAKWVFEEEHTGAALRLLDRGADLRAPDFFLIEVDNIVCKRIRRGLISEEKGTVVRAALRRFPIQLYPFSLVLDSAYATANRTRRSLYDCLYVALASLLEVPLVTADRRLVDGLADGPLADRLLWVEDLP